MNPDLAVALCDLILVASMDYWVNIDAVNLKQNALICGAFF